MSKRITDFFNLGSNKRQKNSVNDQDDSEQTYQNKYPLFTALDKAVTASNQSSQDTGSIKQSIETKESTSSITVEASQPSTSFSKPNSDSAQEREGIITAISCLLYTSRCV